MELKKVIAKVYNTTIFNCRYKKYNEYTSYLYHNLNNLNSYSFSGQHGFKFQYSFCEFYTSDVKIIEGDFKEVKFNENLSVFEEVEDLNLIYLFVINNGRFKDYNEISLTKEGLIELKNSENNKKLEIKVGRFIRSLLDDNKDFIIKNELINFDRIDTNVLEKITNTYKRYALNNKLNLEIVKGEDILKGYTRDNYFIKNNRSSLASSCMSDKHNYLELYTKNSNIELAIVYFMDKVVARCLVWNTNIDGKNLKLYDAIYSNFDWAEKFLQEELEKLGIYSEYSSNRTLYVKLEYIPEKYPYVDTFYYLDSYGKFLSNRSCETDWDLKLRDDSGGYYVREDEDEYDDENY